MRMMRPRPMCERQKAQAIMIERRRMKRTKVDGFAAVLPAEAHELVRCDVLDLTDKGARLDIGRMRDRLRDDFDFTFDNFRTIRPSRLVWCHGSIAGVEFIADQKPRSPTLAKIANASRKASKPRANG